MNVQGTAPSLPPHADPGVGEQQPLHPGTCAAAPCGQSAHRPCRDTYGWPSLFPSPGGQGGFLGGPRHVGDILGTVIGCFGCEQVGERLGRCWGRRMGGWQRLPLSGSSLQIPAAPGRLRHHSQERAQSGQQQTAGALATSAHSAAQPTTSVDMGTFHNGDFVICFRVLHSPYRQHGL